jgi:hypothetical protein
MNGNTACIKAAIPVGANNSVFMCCSNYFFSKVVFPVPALPVKKTDRCV